jgi:uncharacterized protein YceK
VLVVGILLGGCETAVEPVTGTKKAYTVYGILDPTRSEQTAKVETVAARIARTSARGGPSERL